MSLPSGLKMCSVFQLTVQEYNQNLFLALTVRNRKLYRNLLFISKKYDLNLTKNIRMGIISLVLIVILILIFFLSKIPNLNLARKVLIVLAVVFVLIGGLAYIFITGFESGGRPNFEKIESMQEIQNENEKSSQRENNKHRKDPLNEVMSEKDILFNGKLRRYFTVKEFEKIFGKADSIKLLAEEEPCTYIFDTEPPTDNVDDNKYFYKDGSRFENFKEKVAVDEFRFLKNNFILFNGKKLSASTTVSELQKIFPNAVRDMGITDINGERELQVITLREDENNVSDGHINIFLKNGKLHSMQWWFPC